MIEPTIPPVTAQDFNLFPIRRERPVHIAVLCPPGSAVTVLLNRLSEKGGVFVLQQMLPIQTSGIASINGHTREILCPLLIFAIQKPVFEAWIKKPYDSMGAYQMAEIMDLAD